ncbi:MAG: SCP2 sterol-binding domain-containing protein [Thermoplasmata archaeon]|nr:SCP2 sterol-binding domain-containing protein [Thermoplasmata archaeon]
MSEMEALIQEGVEKFKKAIAENPAYKKELQGWKRRVLIDAGEEKYHFLVEDGEIKEMGTGEIEADITVTAEPEIFIGLLKKEISPMKAIAKKQLKINASLSDMLKLRKFF